MQQHIIDPSQQVERESGILTNTPCYITHIIEYIKLFKIKIHRELREKSESIFVAWDLIDMSFGETNPGKLTCKKEI